MPTITGTNGNDNLVGTSGADTIYPLHGQDVVDGLGDSDTLVIDYSSAQFDPFAGAAVIFLESIVTSSGGSFSGIIRVINGAHSVSFSNIEHLEVTLDSYFDTFNLDGAALAQGATISLDGGGRTDTLIANLSALASVDMQVGPAGITASFGTIVSFEEFRLTLTNGADTVTTGAGNDTLIGNGGDDVLNGGGGNDTLSGGTGTNTLNAGDGLDSIASSGIDAVDGGADFDRWTGNYAASTTDLIFTRDKAAGTGALSNGTSLIGVERIVALTTGSGNDVFTFGAPEGFILAAGGGEDTLNLTGNASFGVVSADGASAFAGTLDTDTFSGIEHLNFIAGAESGTLSVDAAPLLAGATLSVDGGAGSDRLALDLTDFGAITFIVAPDGTLTTNVPASITNFETYEINSGAGNDMITTSGGADVIRGGGGTDVLNAGGGNDLLDGGGGTDSMTGGFGDDIYVVDDMGDSVVENAGQGFDEVQTTLASYSLVGTSIENLTGIGSVDQLLVGNSGVNRISGGGGNDVLDGGVGADTMEGGSGNDIYSVDNAGDVVTEFLGQGNDRVFASVSYQLDNFAEVELLSVADQSGTTAQDLIGSNWRQTIFGNDGVNSLEGRGDNDMLWGLAGDDVLDGGGGNDVTIGGAGNDIHLVEGANDAVLEGVGEGNDRVLANGSFRLGIGSEVELISAAYQAFDFTLNLAGNEFAQSILGNEGSNSLEGLGGNDHLWGIGGSDVLDGGSGDDVMIGADGNDTYAVDSFNDVIIDGAGQGSDRVLAYGSYRLAANAEIELISIGNQSGNAAVDLMGNGFDQIIIGNNGVNVLEGLGGNDTLSAFSGDDILDGGTGNDIARGGAGNDTYAVDSALDQLVEGIGQGSDRLYASASYALGGGVEVELVSVANQSTIDAIDLTGNEFGQVLFGNDGLNTLSGGGGNDTLWGLGGNDLLDGGTGTDNLVGGNGEDVFRFTAAVNASNADTIFGYAAADDVIHLHDAVFTGLALGSLNANAFVTGTAAQDADDRIIYDSATGNLFFDADGNGSGAAVLFATLQGAPAITASEFVVI
jgi:Ca2+-binding RTX toxin-like protein